NSIPWNLEHQPWSNHGIIDLNDTSFGYLQTPRIFRPTDAYQVSYAVIEAEGVPTTIRALGSGWSFSDAVLPQKEKLTADEQADAAKGLAKVEEAMVQDGSLDDRPLTLLASGLSQHFGYAVDTTSLNRSLQTLLPGILAAGQDVRNFCFVEAGMTIYDLNI